jgi:GNAT superfamily N-acetyltransferase
MHGAEDYLSVTVTQLEMSRSAAPVPVRAPLLPQTLTFRRIHEPTPSFYRYLYDTVGEPWLWYERRQVDDAALRAIIGDESIAVVVLYYGGVPAGFAEIDTRITASKPHDATLLAYFGLVPDFIGRGLGRFFLNATIQLAWEAFPADRLVVRTCTLDHPAALPLYQKCGFLPTGQQTTRILDPRKLGVLPPDAGPHRIVGA